MRSLINGDFLSNLWLVAFFALAALMLVVGITSGYFKARKCQPKGFKWKQFRFEAMIAVVSLFFSGFLIGGAQTWLKSHGWITFQHEPAAWWVILLEYAAYFISFDTWFYWLHRWMHNEPYYKWIHKLHHRSTSPNLLTTLSVHPLESIINGGWMVIFITLYPVHDASMALIGPTNIFMGLYVHSGYEFLPKWWNKTWATKWFISTTFHDHHHRYFNYNFGGYTSVWDRICGTMRKNFDADFVKIKERPIRQVKAEPKVEEAVA
ncbi:MAG: sterol desaturase family protein [Novosphingobium sp.]